MVCKWLLYIDLESLASRTLEKSPSRTPYGSFEILSHSFELSSRGFDRTATYLGCLCKDEFRVFHQALQGHRHIYYFHLLILPAVVINKLPIPGVHYNQTCISQEITDVMKGFPPTAGQTLTKRPSLHFLLLSAGW